ncbi:MAG: pseudouridine synthase, partial [Bradyrhizobium sp.]|nr:pseudouridine synthase [Bradyrhizobium sp.]
MPRDNDKNNDSRGRRDRPSGGKGRSGAARGPEKKFAKRGFAGKDFAGKSDGARPDGERRPYAGKPDGAKSFGKKPYSGPGKPYAGKREGPPPRRDGDAPRPRFNRDDRAGGGEKRPYAPRGDRPGFNRDDRPRGDGEKRPYTPRGDRGDRGDARPGARFSDRKFGDKKPYTPREGGGEKRPYTPRGDRPQGDRPYSARPSRDGDRPRGDRPERKFGGDKKFSSRGAPDRGPRKDFGSRDRNSGPGDRGPDRGESKPWQKRDASSPDHAGRNSRPPRDGARNFDKPRFDKPRFDKPREERGGAERPRFSRPREDRPQGDRPFRERPKFDRPREGGSSWQEHPRSEAPGERPRRDNEDDSKVFAKRPAFGGRGEYRERKPEFEKRAARPPREKKSGERIAKVLSRAGISSRREAERLIEAGEVTVNGKLVTSPALNVTAADKITVSGQPVGAPEPARLWLYYKPEGLVTSASDEKGRDTVFDNLPEDMPRVMSIGRLDLNSEGLLLLTNDGALKRQLELPSTGWLRKYRVRVKGNPTEPEIEPLRKGITIDGERFQPMEVKIDRHQGANAWLTIGLREGKNREIRRAMFAIGMTVNRLIRVSYGPFRLNEMEPGDVEEIKARVMRDQLGALISGQIEDASDAQTKPKSRVRT